MKTKILFYLIISLAVLSCSENDNTALDSSQIDSQKLIITDNNIEATTYWPRFHGTYYSIFIGGLEWIDICIGYGICSDVLVPLEMSPPPTEKPIKLKIKQGLLNVQLLNDGVSFTEVQQTLNDYGSDMDAQEMYNTIRNTVNIQGTMVLDAELTETLIPNSNGQELVIIPGEYSIDYSNSEFGEFNLSFEMN